jgi:hypothetical protein
MKIFFNIMDTAFDETNSNIIQSKTAGDLIFMQATFGY